MATTTVFKKIINLLPDTFVLGIAIISPITLALLFYAKQYYSHVYSSNASVFANLNNDWMQNLIKQYPVVDWLHRFVDFAIWGVFALVVILIIWGIASLQVAVENHYATEDFINFQENKILWHEKFFIVLLIKTILIAVTFYSIVAIVIRYVSQLSVSVDQLVVAETLTPSMFLDIGKTCLIMTAYIVLIVTCVRTFMHLRND